MMLVIQTKNVPVRRARRNKMSGVLSWREKQANEIKELKKQVEELKKENTELQRELSVHNFLDTGVPQERLDYQRELKKELNEFRYLYGSVISRINKLEDDTRAAIEFADLAEDDKGTEMILKFCEDITKLVGE